MNLDDKNEILKINPENTIEAVYNIPHQITQVLNDLQNVTLPESYHLANKILLSGMGGSRLGGIVAEKLFENELRIPLVNFGGYELPSWVDKNTLFYASSYSGTTEETLESLNQAEKLTDKIIIFSSDGELGKIAQTKNYPGYYNFDTKYIGKNPPRYSVGYQIIAFLIFLVKLGFIKFDLSSLQKVVEFMLQMNKNFGLETPTTRNKAKSLAMRISPRLINLVSSEHLMGVIHVMRNQFTESGKQFASYSDIPELNHFQMEGLANPKENSNNLMYLFFESDLFHPRNQKRYRITQQVLEKNHIPYEIYKLEAKDKITQVFELLQFGSFLTYYLGLLNNVNPAPQTWVDYFKAELKK